MADEPRTVSNAGLWDGMVEGGCRAASRMNGEDPDYKPDGVTPNWKSHVTWGT